jgi:hypothetical protein
MSDTQAARAVADATLYEGYVLYPYRASAQKNHSRWQFGVVMPPAFADRDPSETASCQTQCILEYSDDTVVEVLVRFLQVQRRESPGEAPWDEAVERELTVRTPIGPLLAGPHREPVHVDGGEDVEDPGVIRRRHRLDGTVTVCADMLPGPWRTLRLTVQVANATELDPVPDRREDALPAAMVAVHTILAAEPGAFVSMVDPPEWATFAIESCVNHGTWPVLAGANGGRDVMLSSPIILYDHPDLAPESPGDLYDATEIDEILSLRTLALTDEEKREARATDPRAAAVIDRVESMDKLMFERLHGAIRYLGTVPNRQPERDPPTAAAWWDPEADASVSPFTDTVTVNGVPIGHGSTVVLRPGGAARTPQSGPGTRRTDAQDMFLTGRRATVEAVLLDVEDRPYLAVTLVEDPAAELQRSHGRFLYFSPDEIEPA